MRKQICLLILFFYIMCASLLAQNNASFKVGSFALEKSSNIVFRVNAFENGSLTMSYIKMESYEEFVRIIDNPGESVVPYLPQKGDLLIKSDKEIYKVLADISPTEKQIQIESTHHGGKVIEVVSIEFLDKILEVRKASVIKNEPPLVKNEPAKKENINVTGGYCFFSMDDLLKTWQTDTHFYYKLKGLLEEGKDEFKVWLRAFNREDIMKYDNLSFESDTEKGVLLFDYSDRSMSPQREKTRLRGTITVINDRILSVQLSNNAISNNLKFQIEVIGFSFFDGRRSVTLRVFGVEPGINKK